MTLDNSSKKEKQQNAAKFPQYMAALIANLAGFVIGTCRGWTSTSEYPLVEEAQYGFPISNYDFSWIASLMVLGCFFGTPFYGWSITHYGRKRMMIIFGVPAFLGYIMISFANSVTMLSVGRLMAGLGAGGYSVAIPLYTGEYSEPYIRGNLGVFFQILVTSGILFSYVVGSLVTVRWLSVLCIIIPVVHGLLVLFIPESPIYYLEQNKEQEARKSLQWFRGKDYNIEEEFSIKKKYVDEGKLARISLFEAFSTKAAKKGLMICTGLMVIRQVCGASGVIFYNTVIFREAGSSMSPNLQTIILGIMDLVFTFVSSTVVDKLGRRPLLFVSTSGMATCTFFIGLFFYLKDRNYNVQNLTWMPLVFLCIFVMSYSLGSGSLPWVFLGETFPRNIAGHAVSISVGVNFLGSFFVTHFFEDVTALVGREGLFFIFSACSVLGIAFVYCNVIETKNKTLEQIVKELENA